MRERLRILLEGSLEALERWAEPCAQLRALLEGSWRLHLREPQAHALVEAVAASEAAVEQGLARARSLCARLEPDERPALESLRGAVERERAALELRVDQLLRAGGVHAQGCVAAGAALRGALADKLLRLLSRAEPTPLESDERELACVTAELRPVDPRPWAELLRSTFRRGLDEGTLRLTSKRLLFDGEQHQLTFPRHALTLKGAGAHAFLGCDAGRFELAAGDLEQLMLRLRLLEALWPTTEGPGPLHAAPALVAAIRQSDGERGWLLCWAEGLVFAPDSSGSAVLEALAPKPLADYAFGLLGGRAVLEAVAALVNDRGAQVADAVAHWASSVGWRRSAVVLERSGSRLTLTHRSGSAFEPTYRVSDEAFACERALVWVEDPAAAMLHRRVVNGRGEASAAARKA